MGRRLGPILVVLNKADRVPAGDMQEAAAFSRPSAEIEHLLAVGRVEDEP